MHVLVCGGRDFQDKEYLFQCLDEENRDRKISLVIHGGARGADTLSGLWAKSRGVPCTVYQALWHVHGKGAGFIRNAQMLKEGKPNLVVAFAGGRGTENMVSLSRAAGIPVHTL